MKSIVERLYQDQLSNGLFFKALRSGVFTITNLKCYMSNVYHVIKLTPELLTAGMTKADTLGLPALREYYKLKYREEADHHSWALEDIIKINEHYGLSGIDEPLASIIELRRQLFQDSETNPYSYVAYIFVAEYFTVLAGPWILAQCRDTCNIDTKFLSVVESHATLDAEHVPESLREFEGLYREKTSPTEMKFYAEKYCQLIGAFFDDIIVSCDKLQGAAAWQPVQSI